MFFKKVSLVTGGFDPIHSGHLRYFERAKDLSGYLVVGINTNEWLTKKKGQYFLPWVERADIISHLDMVDAVITVPDDDKGSACGAIAECLKISEQVIFCNGGDRTKTNIPEAMGYGDDPRVHFIYGIGGEEKENSSSWILRGYFDRQRKLLGI